MRPLPALAGVLVLAFAWAGPLPGMVRESFAAHMALHMLVVGVGVPLVALGLAPALALRAGPSLAVAVSLADLIVIWAWHAPAPHHLSRSQPMMLALEQASFAAVSLLVWVVALSSPPGRRQAAALAGALTLFFTSMHMTLLGALLGLAPRVLYPGHAHGSDPLADQQLGGAIMLGVGGAVYLAGGLVLVGRALRRSPA